MTYNGSDVKADVSGRARRTLRWEVNVLDEYEEFVNRIVGYWKRTRKGNTYVNRAVLLFYDLLDGKTGRLLAEFGGVIDGLIQARVEERVEERLREMNAEHQAKMDTLERMIGVLHEGGTIRIQQETTVTASPNARQFAAGAYPFTRPPLVVETAAAKADFRETSATFAANLAGLFDEEEW